jgi:diguanylate cyclase (GGDEF)-like protein
VTLLEAGDHRARRRRAPDEHPLHPREVPPTGIRVEHCEDAQPDRGHARGPRHALLHEVVEQRAISDGLTGLSNRRHCEERLADEIARSQRYGAPLALIICDIDEFKAANDTHGHAFGDLVLREFAGILGETLRDVDVSGRWGGEEFLIVLPGTSLDGAVEAAERIRSGFAALELSGETGPVRMTASFGVASFVPGTEPDQLVRSADEALYEAKRRGKDRVRTAPAESEKDIDSLKRVT